MDILDSIPFWLSLAFEWAKTESNRNLLGTVAAIIAIIGGIWSAIRWVRGRDYDTRFDTLEEQTKGRNQSAQSVSRSEPPSEQPLRIETHRQKYVEELVKRGVTPDNAYAGSLVDAEKEGASLHVVSVSGLEGLGKVGAILLN